MASASSSPVWWLLPGKLGGMPRPFYDPRRQALDGNAGVDIQDELTQLSEFGVRALVRLSETPTDDEVYRKAGFELLRLPMDNGAPPTRDQWLEFCRFVDQQMANGHGVVTFCEAGLGRTGTMLAAYLVHCGEIASAAIARVRGVEPAAIDSARQIAFLHEIEGLMRSHIVAPESSAEPPSSPPLSGAA